MNGIDDAQLDEAIATCFTELKKAIDSYSAKSIELYSQALEALVQLRRHLTVDSANG